MPACQMKSTRPSSGGYKGYYISVHKDSLPATLSKASLRDKYTVIPETWSAKKSHLMSRLRRPCLRHVFDDQHCAARLKRLLKSPSGQRYAYSQACYTGAALLRDPSRESRSCAEGGPRTSLLILESLNLTGCELGLSSPRCACCCSVHRLNLVGKMSVRHLLLHSRPVRLVWRAEKWQHGRRLCCI